MAQTQWLESLKEMHREKPCENEAMFPEYPELQKRLEGPP
jgi:hypothetical protein